MRFVGFLKTKKELRFFSTLRGTLQKECDKTVHTSYQDRLPALMISPAQK